MCESSSTTEHSYDSVEDYSTEGLPSQSSIPITIGSEIPVTDVQPQETVISFQDLIIENIHRKITHIALPIEMKFSLETYIKALKKDTLAEIQAGVTGIRSLLDNILTKLTKPYNDKTLAHQAYGLILYDKVSDPVLQLYNRVSHAGVSPERISLMQDINNLAKNLASFKSISTSLRTSIESKYAASVTRLGSDLDSGEIEFYQNKQQKDDLSNIILEKIDKMGAHGIPVKPNKQSFQRLSKHNRVLVARGFLAFDEVTNFSGTSMDGAIPDVAFDTSHPIKNPGAMMSHGGVMSIGLAAIPTQIAHELGHHIENNLSLADFLTLHNFLRGRTKPESGGSKIVGHTVSNMLSGRGYDAVLPKLTFMSKIDHFFFCNTTVKAMVAKNIVNLPGGLGKILRTLFDTVGYGGLGTALGALIGTFVPGLGTITGAIVGGIIGGIFGLLKGLFHSRKKKEENVRNYFYEVSNSQEGSYATMFRQGANPFDQSGSTEFLSTTYELMASKVGREELAKKDPLRVVLFFYLANRPLYNKTKQEFEKKYTDKQLDSLIHVVK